MKVLGLMSGTSLDGIDAALLDLEAESGGVRWAVIGSNTTPFLDERRERIRDAILNGGAAQICRLSADLGEWMADAALGLLEALGVPPEDVELLGSHGQTIWHEPPSDSRGATLQIGCAATLAERTGIPVVSDFRTRDVAAGGQGAPLVPYADTVLFGVPGKARALQNIGGMANVTWMGPDGSVLAFDTGPGNALMDFAAERATGGTLRYDEDGRLAAAGEEDPELLGKMLEHPFFGELPPKSTGREVFGEQFVNVYAGAYAEANADAHAGANADDGALPVGDADAWAPVLATLTRLTARTIGDAYRAWVLPRGLDEVFLLGGGARNPTLVRMIREELADVTVLDGGQLGIDPDAREAAAFAVLAWAHVLGRTGNVPTATGAVGERILGSYTPGRAAGRP